MCWVIESFNSSITLNIVELITEDWYDYVEIRDGQYHTSALIGDSKSGEIYNEKVETTGRYAFVYFESDASVIHIGFRINYYIDPDNYFVDEELLHKKGNHVTIIIAIVVGIVVVCIVVGIVACLVAAFFKGATVEQTPSSAAGATASPAPISLSSFPPATHTGATSAVSEKYQLEFSMMQPDYPTAYYSSRAGNPYPPAYGESSRTMSPPPLYASTEDNQPQSASSDETQLVF